MVYRNTIARFAITFFLITLSVAIAYAAQDEVRLTTYYPSPYGEYTSLKAKSLAVGSSDAYFKANVPRNNLIVEGNVGIGTTNPSSQLQVMGSTAPTISVRNTMRTGVALIMQAANADSAVIGTTSNHPLDLATSGATRMRITEQGKIGIGTLDPDYVLDVEGEGTPVHVMGINKDNGASPNQAIGILARARGTNKNIDDQSTIGLMGIALSENPAASARNFGVVGSCNGVKTVYPIGVRGTASTESQYSDSISVGVLGSAKHYASSGWAYGVCGTVADPTNARAYAGTFYGKVYIDSNLWVHGNLQVDGNIYGQGFPSPNYDSGWIAVGARYTVHTLTHNLGTLNTIVYIELNQADGIGGFSGTSPLGITNYLTAGDKAFSGGHPCGMAWGAKTANTIKVYNLYEDTRTRFRVLLWKY